jgi:NAD dependent epimerase/dehydratase
MTLNGKRVLVTGADGFIGSHLVERLLEENAHVLALAQYNSFNNWGWLEDLPCLDRIEVVTGDIRDPHFCLDLCKGAEAIFHLAALIPIPYSYKAPDSYVDTNVKGTLNICHAALANHVERLIHTSTSEVYGTAQYIPIDEKHPLNPQSPYSATKIGADAVAMSFYHSFELPVVLARPFNTYGPRQSARAVIPAIITQIAAGREHVTLGNLAATRDITFVKDTCDGLVAIGRMSGGAGEVFHIGSNQEISIGDLFSMIAGIMKSDAIAVTDRSRLRPERSEVERLRCDCSKLRNATGFDPKISLHQGLALTIRWFQDERNLRRFKEDIYNV